MLTNATESFLPFDLDAAFASTVLLLMASASDNSLASREDEYWNMSETILEEISSRGNLIARHMKAELNQLNNIFSQLPPSNAASGRSSANRRARRQGHERSESATSMQTELATGYPAYAGPMPIERCDWQNGFTSENLTLFAEALNPDDLDWISSTVFDVNYMPTNSDTT